MLGIAAISLVFVSGCTGFEYSDETKSILNVLLPSQNQAGVTLPSNASNGSGNIPVPNESTSPSSTPTAASGGVSISKEEYCSRQVRNYEACVLPGGCWYVETPRKGTDLIDYFKSLNTTNEYIYVLMQFEGCFGTPTEEQRKTLNDDGIALFDFYGDYTYYAKVPRNILETKSYDFVRWIGPINTSLKIEPELFNKIKENCTGNIIVSVHSFESLTQSEVYLLDTISEKIVSSSSSSAKISLSIKTVEGLAALQFIRSVYPFYDINPKEDQKDPDPFEGLLCE